MAADPQRQEATSNDLFGRWLAHHTEQQTSGQGEQTESAEGTAETETSGAQRRLPAAAVASSAVERDPMIGSRIAPPSTFGARRSTPNAPQGSGPGNQVDRESPAGWEPIVMRSIRKKTEQPPKPVDTRSRLQRLKARLVDPPAPEPEVEVPLVPLAPPVARSVPLPVATPKPSLPTSSSAPSAPSAPAAPVARSVEETIRAAVPTIERQVARHAEPRVEEQPEPKPVEPVEQHVARHSEPRVERPVQRLIEAEEVAPPAAVRAFIDAAPVVTEPEPEPVAESVVAEAEPEPMTFAEPTYVVEPVIEPVVAPAPVVAATIGPPEPTEDEPAAFSFLSLPKRRAKEAYVEPEPVAEPVAESVVVQAQPETLVITEPAPVIEPVIEAVIEPVIEPSPVVAATIEVEPEEATEDQPRRSFLSLQRLQPKDPKAPEPRESGREDRPLPVDVPVAPPAAQEAHEAQETQEALQSAAVAVAAPPEPVVEPRKVSKHDEVATEMPGLYKFAAKRTSRRLLTISLLIGMVASAYFVRAAVEVKETPSIGLAAIVVLATAMVWAIRAGASVTKLEVHQGQLQVIQQGGTYIFDLASQYTRFEVHGQPGHRGWKVLFPRRGMAPFTVDASMVDPDDFMRVLRFFRPQLVHH
jgi:hypothetical protein